ncbi:MAG: hypothetical protein V1872_09200 [bacterium]
MKAKVKDITIDELKILISDTIKDTMEDLLEDMLALSSKEYVSSIKEAREDYEDGKIKYLEELFDV